MNNVIIKMESAKTLNSFMVTRWNEDDQTIEFLESVSNESYDEAFHKYFTNIFRVQV